MSTGLFELLTDGVAREALIRGIQPGDDPFPAGMEERLRKTKDDADRVMCHFDAVNRILADYCFAASHTDEITIRPNDLSAALAFMGDLAMGLHRIRSDCDYMLDKNAELSAKKATGAA